VEAGRERSLGHLTLLAVECSLLAILLFSGRRPPVFFTLFVSLAALETYRWNPHDPAATPVFYALEAITVPLRIAVAAEALWGLRSLYLIVGAPLMAWAGVILAWERPIQASLWFQTFMRARALLWLALAVLLLVLATDQWAIPANPRKRLHLVLTTMYFVCRAIFAFGVLRSFGEWSRHVDLAEALNAACYAGWIVTFWPRKNDSSDQV
jgi:hypothetical protein